eukprot:TRINITY_DN17154_c0_g1_i1.p1 TRINITY_DN17154_c0_g1~~TRINITY_DN17154_c0_g1_i1.p1  ORF type:complete len:687 (+),score=180.50 TRINITY_DN17154_c0_g1_i1:62-2062(+)
MQRVQIYPLLQVPDTLDNPSWKYDKSNLLRGHVINRYTNSGQLVVTNVLQRTSYSVPNPSQIAAITFSYPHVVTVHQSGLIQVYDIEGKQTSHYSQYKDIVSGFRCILADNKNIIGVSIKKLTVWERDKMKKDGEPDQASESAPHTVELEGAPCIAAIHDQKSLLLSDNRVILVNNNPGGHLFQVWDFLKGELLGYAENPSKTESAVTFAHHKDLIVTSVKDALHIWNIAGKPGPIKPIPVTFPDSIVTAVHIDSNFLVVGDNFGGVTLHDLEGTLIYPLNRVKRGDVNIKDVELTKLSSMFKARVHKLTRVGRWVVVAFENSKVEIYDIFNANMATPCDSYVHSVAASVRDFVIHEQKIFMAVHVIPDAKMSKATKHKPDIVVWTPKLEYEGFEHFTQEPTPPSSAVDILSYGCNGLTSLVHKLEGLLRADDVKPMVTCLNSATAYLKAVDELQVQTKLPVPFLVFQNVQESLDNYESRLGKLFKSQGPAIRVGKIKEQIEALNTALTQSLELMVQAAEFLGDVKSKVGPNAVLTSDQVVVSSSANKRLLRKKSYTRMKKAAESKIDEDEQDDAIDELLFDVMDNLESMFDTLVDQTERYDQVCNAGVPDQDRVVKLLNIYTKLKQITEDLKETGKSVGEVRGEDGSGKWWEGGGAYLEETQAQK